MKEYLGKECRELILGEKLNDFKPAKSTQERNRIIKLAKEWISQNPNKNINLY